MCIVMFLLMGLATLLVAVELWRHALLVLLIVAAIVAWRWSRTNNAA